MVPPIRVHAITHKSLHLPGSKCPRLLNRVKRCSKGTRVKACSGAAMERGDPMPAFPYFSRLLHCGYRGRPTAAG